MADDAVCVWDLNDATRTTSPQLVLRGHAGGVSALAALDDGRLASAGQDKVIRIWNVAGGILEAATPIATLEGHTDAVGCLAALDGGRIASGSADGSVIIWNLADGEPLLKLKESTGIVFCLAALHSNRLASGSNDKSIIVWSIVDGLRLDRFEGHTDDVRCLATLYDGQGIRLVSGSDDKSIIVWNSERDWTHSTNAKHATLKGHSDSVLCLAVAAHGIRLVSGGRDKTIIIWNPARGTQLARLKGHTDWVRCLTVLDGGLLVSGSKDKSIIMWDLGDRAQVATLEGHTNEVNCLAVLADGRLASGGTYVDKKKEKTTALSAINDSCKTGVDRFGSRPLAGAIVEVVEGASPPICVGLYAKWGRGKSFLIHQIKQHFDPTARIDPRGGGALVQHFEPGYDKLERAVTDITPEKDKKASSSTCGKVLNIIGNALFYLLTLTLWWFYKKETVLTIIDTVVETINDLGAIGKDLKTRAATVTEYSELRSNDDVESKDAPEPEYIFVDFNACTDSVSLKFLRREYAQSDELWTGLVKKMYAAVELRLSKQPQFDRKKELTRKEARVVTSLASGDWKTAWRVKRAKEVLGAADEWSKWGLRLRALLMVFMPPILVLLSSFVIIAGILDFADKGFGLFSKVADSFKSIKKFFDLVTVAVTAAPIIAGIATYRAGVKTDEVAGKSRGDAFFEEAAKQEDSVKDRLGFLARVKNEVTELFSFLHTLKEETGVELIIVPFVDDLDRVMGGNGDRVTKVLEAVFTQCTNQTPLNYFLSQSPDLARPAHWSICAQVSLILSIENAPVVTFLAIDPRIVISSIEDGFGAVIQDAKVTGWEYLDKIVQFPIAIPQPASVKIARFVSYVVDPSDAKPEAVAARLRKFVKTVKEIEETSSLDEYAAVFPGAEESGQPVSFQEIANLIEGCDDNDTTLVRCVAKRLDSTRDVENLIESIGEEGLEMTCRALNDAFRAVKIIIDSERTHAKIYKAKMGNKLNAEYFNSTFEGLTPRSFARLQQKLIRAELENAEERSAATLPERPSSTKVGLAQLKNFSDGGDLSERIQATLVPSFDESALLVSAAEQVTLRAFAKQTSGNPRRLKRVVNVFQLAVAYAKRLALDEANPTKIVYLDRRWPLFACKLVKFIVLCCVEINQ